MLSIYLRHLPAPRSSRRVPRSLGRPPPRPPPPGHSPHLNSPIPPHPVPTLSPPRRRAPRSPKGPDTPGYPASGSQEAGRWRGEALPGPASPPSRPASSGDSPPPETAEKLGQDAGTTTLRLLRDPPQAGLRNSPLRTATCPSPFAHRSAGPKKARAGIPCKRPFAAAAHLTPLLQHHPNAIPSWGMDAPASRPGRPWRGQAGDWLSRAPPPPPRPLRLRRLGWG